MFCRRTAEWVLAAAVFLLPGCAGAPDEPRSADAAHTTSPAPTESLKPSGLQTAVPSSAGSSVSVTPPSAGGFASATPDEGGRASPFPADADEKNRDDSIAVVADADDPLVLVNKTRKLPDGYRPPDLVQPDVPFVPTAPAERRLMRREAARALEELFAAAGRAGLDLKAVSGFRSYETQAALYAYYVRTEGEQHASQFSARPGHSEHQTGLAMDVSSGAVGYALEPSFADTKEGRWLAAHAAEFGFIIRYPKGKEAMTGYAYEPWHIRYVGRDAARAIAASGLTLEEYVARTMAAAGAR